MRSRRRIAKDHSIVWLLRLLSYLVFALVFWIICDLVYKGASTISWTFLSEAPQAAGLEGGIFPALIGTFLLITLTLICAFPLGVAGAIYLSEYAQPGRLTRTIRLGIVTLAGVPSIVFGLFGLGLFVLFMKLGSSALAGGLTLACMILPTIIVSSEESLRAVPRGLREASLALGATQWQTIRKSVLPFALPGMMTGGILGIGRAAGETAPIIFTAAAFYLVSLPKSVFDQVMALPYHLFVMSTQHHDTDRAMPMAYGTALVLVALVLVFSSIAIALRLYMRRKYRW